MLLVPDLFDPNLLEWVNEREHYIYGDDHGNAAARVDAEDYQFFCRWRWHVKFDKHGKKPYLVRTIAWYVDGIKTRSASLFLHVAIKERADPVRPARHSMVDHVDGDTLHCRRSNLDYATPSMNRRNIRGQRRLRL